MASDSGVAASDSDELTYILLRRGTNLQQVKHITDGGTVESKLARGRGGGELIEGPTLKRESQPEEESTGIIDFSEGMLTAETAFFMHFIPTAEYRNLTPYDIASLPQNIAYPVNQTTLNSLPNWALSKLREQGHLKIKAEYTDNEFQNVHEGWNTATNPYDRILQLADEFDGDIIQVVYYLAAENGSGTWSDPKTMADIRDIKTESVEDAISKIKRQIESESE